MIEETPSRRDERRQFRAKQAGAGGGEHIQSRSSVWLEHYTDNVGVSSSNLLGTTRGSRDHILEGGISSAG